MANMDPAVLVPYGPVGQGKTANEIMSWGARGLFVCQPGALRVADTVAGYPLHPSQVKWVDTMEATLPLIRTAKAGGFSAVVVDDGSLLMANTMNKAREQFAIVKKGVVTGYDFGMYTYLRGVLMDIAFAARWAGVHVIINAHEQAATRDEKTNELYPAGPDFGWKKLVKDIPAMACVVLHVIKRLPEWQPWDTRADCDNSDPMFTMKDRFDVAPLRAGPLNTAEMLRAAGFPVERPPTLAWMEEVVVHVAQAILSGQTEVQATGPWVGHLQKHNVDPRHVRWALRDGVHRARFAINKQKAMLAGFA